MKKHPIYHRILLICALLLGTVGALRADVTNPGLVPTPGARIEKETGIFSRFFGRIAGRMDRANQDDDDEDDGDDDDDEEDDDRRFRPRGSQSPFTPPAPGTTIITTKTTTNRAPISSEHPDANRYPRRKDATRSIAPPTSRPLSVPQKSQPSPRPPPPPAPFAGRNPPVQEQIRAAIVPALTVLVPARTIVVPPPTVVLVQTLPASRWFPVSPPRSTTPAPSEVRDDTLPLQPPSQLAPSASLPAFRPGDPASLRAPVVPRGSATPSSSSFANRIPVAVTPSQGLPSVNAPSAQQPDPPPPPAFGTPVPGRRGLVYPPGQEATPENMIDVTDYAPGTKVRDPVSKLVFRVP